MDAILSFVEGIKNKIAAYLYRVGLSPNFITLLGLFFAFLSGLLIYQGRFFLGAGALLFSGLLDLLDGAVARAAGAKGFFGGILDSSLDRYGDGFIFGGIFFYCAVRQYYLYAVLAFSALLGAFLISYVRARAECEIESCKVGFWERGERLVYIALGLWFNNLSLVLWVLGIGTHVTVLLRLYYAANNQKTVLPEIFFQTQGRKSLFYAFKAVILFLLVLCVRP